MIVPVALVKGFLAWSGRSMSHLPTHLSDPGAQHFQGCRLGQDPIKYFLRGTWGGGALIIWRGEKDTAHVPLLPHTAPLCPLSSVVSTLLSRGLSSWEGSRGAGSQASQGWESGWA